MKKFFIFFIGSLLPLVSHGAFSCGDGYALVESKRVDGIDAFQCQRVWCMDLEAGAYMGSGDRANSGYSDTREPYELCDNAGNCVMCFGERRWCSGEQPGEWRPEYGAYVRGDGTAYQSYKKGSCFGWRLEKPNCPDGQIAILDGGNYICGVRDVSVDQHKASSVRRTTSVRKLPTK